jgi:hypothetical protein
MSLAIGSFCLPLSGKPDPNVPWDPTMGDDRPRLPRGKQ